MKINLADSRTGFTRPQLLLLIFLCAVAFEIGVRYAEKQAAPPTVITRTITTNAVTTKIVTEAQPAIPQVEEETETNLPPETNSLILAQRPTPPKTNSSAKPSPGGGPEGPGSRMLKGEVGGPYKRKSPSTNSVISVVNEPSIGSPYGIRLQLP